MIDNETGFVIGNPSDAGAVADAIDRLLSDPALASRQGQAARHRAETEFAYDVLVHRLSEAIGMIGAQARALTVTRRAGLPTTVLARHPRRVRRFPDVEEQVTERMIIRGAPERCYDVLTSFEAYPEWAADIKSVSVDERDERGPSGPGHLPGGRLRSQYVVHPSL